MDDSSQTGRCRPTQPMGSSDVIDLAVLGAAADAPLRVAVLPLVLHEMLHEMGGDTLSPTVDVIAGRAAALVAQGLLAEAPPLADGAPPGQGASPAVATSDAGRHRVRDLMCRPGPAADSPLGMVADRLRLCLLDLLEAADRAVVLARLESARRERLGRLRRAAAHCPCSYAFMRRWLAHEASALDAELSWIGNLALVGAPATAGVTRT